MPEAAQAASESREIRVFLSSTFRDFNEERRLLATQVFPELNRRARERGVELVEVDLRWGVTQEQAEDGHALEICLQEIERCQRYFIGMLGDSYGSLTPPERDLLVAAPELLEKRQWLNGRIGQSSYTELEIEQRLQDMSGAASDGRAFFYLRDPAYSNPRADAGEPGWRSDAASDRQKLEALRRRIKASGYPVVEGLPNPQAMADRIKDDLWALIERLFPEGEQPDALDKDARKHADYRRSRSGAGQYIGGEVYIEQLEQWLEEGEQQILITGESGAGKSALIANWMECHSQRHPADVLYAHHLGCTNDANALRPMLGRLIDTASQQLLDAEVITEALAVPEDWWELVAKVAETLQTLGRWCKQQGRRWIWVLDGLDRLDPDDQSALPWLPLNLPDAVQVVASALACPAREMLIERGYTTLTIEPLASAEQEQLIQHYLKRYTKELDGGLRQLILDHPLAASPLFLKVLLEELRQCGRHDTLKEQLAFYLSSQTVDDLYERVLERLENDGSGEGVRKVMTALWASRAGLTEPELLAITGLKPLQWASIDLALEKAFGRNGNRLVFDHDYLRIAVQDRYLPTDVETRQARSGLADWFEAKDEWDERDSEELPWQWQEAGRLDALRDHLLNPVHLAYMSEYRDSREIINYWLAVRDLGDGELDELIAEAVEEEIEKRDEDPADQIWFVDRIAELLDEAGLYRDLLLWLREIALKIDENMPEADQLSILERLDSLAQSYLDCGNLEEAERICSLCLEGRQKWQGQEHLDTLATLTKYANIKRRKGVANEDINNWYDTCWRANERQLGKDHPTTLTALCNLAGVKQELGETAEAERLYKACLDARIRIEGEESEGASIILNNLAGLYCDTGEYDKAENIYIRDLRSRESRCGKDHPSVLTSAINLGDLYSARGDLRRAFDFTSRALDGLQHSLGREHYFTLIAMSNLGLIHLEQGDHERASELLGNCLDVYERTPGADHEAASHASALAETFARQEKYSEAVVYRRKALARFRQALGDAHPRIFRAVYDLADDLMGVSEFEEAEQFYREALGGHIKANSGVDSSITMAIRYDLACCLSAQGRYHEAIELRRMELAWCHANDDVDAKDTLVSMHSLGCDLLAAGETVEALQVLQQCLHQRHQELGASDDDTLTTMAKVLEALSELERQHEGLALAKATEATLAAELGDNHPKVLTQLGNQASLHEELGDLKQAEALQQLCLSRRVVALGAEHPDTLSSAYNLAELFSQQERHAEAIPLRRRELAWCRATYGDTDEGTLASLNALAIDLRETGELEEAEALFRELLASRQEVLEPDDFLIGRSLGGLAKTLEEAGKLQEAAAIGQEALDHRLRHEGSDAWWTNRNRLDLARMLHNIGRFAEALSLLEQLQQSMAKLDQPDQADRDLVDAASELRLQVELQA